MDTLAARLNSRLLPTDHGCLEYSGARRRGYGRIYDGGRNSLAHRVAWELANGPIPDGLAVCHACDNPPCCNVDHLFLGTWDDNAKDRDRKGRGHCGAAKLAKTHCNHGHAYTDENTYTSTGFRRCKTCCAEAMRRWREKKARIR